MKLNGENPRLLGLKLLANRILIYCLLNQEQTISNLQGSTSVALQQEILLP